jgi:hypothetical protein
MPYKALEFLCPTDILWVKRGRKPSNSPDDDLSIRRRFFTGNSVLQSNLVHLLCNIPFRGCNCSVEDGIMLEIVLVEYVVPIFTNLGLCDVISGPVCIKFGREAIPMTGNI